MDEPRAGAPAWLLIITGAVYLTYSVFYGLWTLFPIGLIAMAQINIFLDGKQGFLEALFGFFLLTAVPLFQLFGFCITFLMGAITIFGGIRLRTYRSKGIVWLAVLCAVGMPLLALLINAGSALNIGAFGFGCFTGCLLGNIPTLVLLILGIVSAILGAVALSSAPDAER